MAREFKFEISLSVLDHLGRNLYRSFATVLGEAISNAWDADAEHVHICIDTENNNFFIKDDGMGMTADDFQKKFLKIGYSKRVPGESAKTKKGRPFIGRKGIGKLALLSCAKKISVISKVPDGEYIGGTINNSVLNDRIRDDARPDDYTLFPLDEKAFSPYTDGHNHGTIIKFEDIEEGVKNSLDFLRKITALYFRFSLLDSSFKIYINGKKVKLSDLSDLAGKTEFLWNINKSRDPYILEMLTNLKEEAESIDMHSNVDGFIASVEKPLDLSIMTTGEREGIDLFVNGRLRERDILKHISTARVAESYFYGQIHFNELDDGEEDRFTSSREGIVADDPEYKIFIEEFQDILWKVVRDWDTFRVKHREDGDSENKRIPRDQRKGRELYNAVIAKYRVPKRSANQEKIEGWVGDLEADAAYNFASYAHCFISENLLRKYIDDKGEVISCMNVDKTTGETCEDRYDPEGENTNLCKYCKGKDRRKNLQEQKDKVDLLIPIRSKEDSFLTYLDYIDLAQIINYRALTDADKPYRLLRNSVMHTSLLTRQAKTKLTSVFDNIVATVKKLVGES